ncbi:MAG TPA: hypothetical protein VHW23_06650, partial [Kofleriaceae bacterium]|nr:hypothetical protein [Kofleriaceae bacterium]
VGRSRQGGLDRPTLAHPSLVSELAILAGAVMALWRGGSNRKQLAIHCELQISLPILNVR